MDSPPAETAAETSHWIRALFYDAPGAIGFSRDGTMLDANPAYLRLFGYDHVEELRGRSLIEQIAPSHRAEVLERVARRSRGESEPHHYRTRGLRRDGTEFPFEVNTTRVMLADGPISIAFVVDVSERERSERELSQTLAAVKASEEMFRILSSAAFEGVFVYENGKVVLANEAGAEMFGYSPEAIIGVSVVDLAAPELRGRIGENIRQGNTVAHEGVAQRKDGTRFPCEVRARTLTRDGKSLRVTVIRDLTERKRIEESQRALEERVRQAQKLESLSVLAGGVAHDFNNLLTIIRNELGLAKRESGSATTLARLDTIDLATERAADLCRQMLAYAGKTHLGSQVIDLSALAAETSGMIAASISKNVTIERDLAPDLPPILGDPTQIRQVLMNLVLTPRRRSWRPRVASAS